MKIAQTILRASLAILVAMFTLSVASAWAASDSCLTLSNPNELRIVLLELEHAALAGP